MTRSTCGEAKWVCVAGEGMGGGVGWGGLHPRVGVERAMERDAARCTLNSERQVAIAGPCAAAQVVGTLRAAVMVAHTYGVRAAALSVLAMLASAALLRRGVLQFCNILVRAACADCLRTRGRAG